MRRRHCRLVGLMVIAACDQQGDHQRDSAAQAPPAAAIAFTPPDSASLRAATEALGAFLDASREGSTTREILPRLTACPSGSDGGQGPMLAKFEIRLTAPDSLTAWRPNGTSAAAARALADSIAAQP
jgi:hypothetical protein